MGIHAVEVKFTETKSISRKRVKSLSLTLTPSALVQGAGGAGAGEYRRGWTRVCPQSCSPGGSQPSRTCLPSLRFTRGALTIFNKQRHARAKQKRSSLRTSFPLPLTLLVIFSARALLIHGPAVGRVWAWTLQSAHQLLPRPPGEPHGAAPLGKPRGWGDGSTEKRGAPQEF